MLVHQQSPCLSCCGNVMILPISGLFAVERQSLPSCPKLETCPFVRAVCKCEISETVFHCVNFLKLIRHIVNGNWQSQNNKCTFHSIDTITFSFIGNLLLFPNQQCNISLARTLHLKIFLADLFLLRQCCIYIVSQ